MAKFKGKGIMKNVRGMLGKQVVVKERLGTEYMSAAPLHDENRSVSDAEQGNRKAFASATEFAKKAMKIPALKELYASLTTKKGNTPYNTAMSDAFSPPKITSLIVQGYTGQAGGVIIVQATDNVKVKSVRVSIFNAANEVIESGEAADHGGLNWMYTATVANPHMAGCVIEARADDIAGNEAVKVYEL